MKRIVQVIDSMKMGGVQKLMVTFVRQAQARGLEATIVGLKFVPGSPIPDEITALGGRVVYLPASHLLSPGRIWRLSRFLRQQRCDVVQTHLTYANIVGPLAAALAGTRVVATLHSTSVDPRHFHPLIEQLEALMLRVLARRVIAVGHSVAAEHRRRLKGKPIEVVLNAISSISPLPEAERNALRAELAGDFRRPLLISVGRLSPPKAFPDMLHAMVTLGEQFPQALLLIVGQGVLYGDLLGLISELGLKDQVKLLGARQDVPRLLVAGDIYLSSSHWEGVPLAVMEAMSAGLPVVATQVGDLPYLLADGRGVLVPVGQPDQLARAVARLLSDEQLRRGMGAAARDYIRRHHNPSAWMDHLLAIYSSEAKGESEAAR